jgi:hypothetical protein
MELGGYGIFYINEMDTCIKAMWIQRWLSEYHILDFLLAAVIGLEPQGIRLAGEEWPKDNKIIGDIISKRKRFKERYYKVDL